MIARALHCLAPAKLNLFLHITGRRPDGYHDLQTLFQLLDFRRVFVDTDNFVSEIRETNTRDQTDIAGANHRNLHETLS